jgi:hypothetical protein
MGKIICLILAGFAINYAQAELLEHEWKATLKVVDENGKPVAGAKISVGYSVYQAVEKRFSTTFSCENPNDFDGRFSKTWLFQRPAM